METWYVRETNGSKLVLQSSPRFTMGFDKVTTIDVNDPNIKIVGSTPVKGRSLVYTLSDGTKAFNDPVVSKHGKYRVVMRDGKPFKVDTDYIKDIDKAAKLSGARYQIIKTAAIAAVDIIATQTQPSAASDASPLTNSDAEVPLTEIIQ